MCAKKRRVVDNNSIHILISNLIIPAVPPQKFSVVSAEKLFHFLSDSEVLLWTVFREIENFHFSCIFL